MIVVVIINVLMLLAFCVILGIGARDALRRLALTNPRFASLKMCFEVTAEEERRKADALREAVGDERTKLKNCRPLDELVERVWEMLRSRPESSTDLHTIHVMTTFQRCREALLVELHGPEALCAYSEYLEAERAIFELQKELVSEPANHDLLLAFGHE